MNRNWRLLLSVLLLVVITVWLAVLTTSGANLRIIACDVGQGDAFLIVQGQSQILIDGGPNDKVIDCLDKYLSFLDRKIEVVILSHPQSDHLRGLIEVFKRFKVDTFVTTQVDSSSQDFGLLKSLVGSSGARVIYATRGSDVRLGLIYLDILSPTSEYFLDHAYKKSDVDDSVLGAYTTKDDLNEFSVVALITFGEFDALFTGDMNSEMSDVLAAKLKNESSSNIEYIKIPHHGSKNGVSRELLAVSDPKVAVISVGKDNSYGHPHKDIIEMLRDRNIKVLRTDLMGDVVVETDGRNFWVEE